MPSEEPCSPAKPRSMDPHIWRACAGSSVQIPCVNSRVYYFPQGHVEQSGLSVTLSVAKPFIPCLITHVDFLADPVSDQVFAKVFLTPITGLEPSRNFPEQQQQPLGNNGNVDENNVVAFAKILTPSDANNGGGFSVPRFCADSIFPPLNYHVDPPVQTLSCTDIHGAVWEFRHIYRGTPRRHLLTTGWSKFVNQKKLIAGDSVVFMRDSRGKMHIGVRRSVRCGNYGDGAASRWGKLVGMKAEAVVRAVEMAALRFPFKVLYYPRAGCADFIVRDEVVDSAMKVLWTAGMRVKMAVETEDSSRMTWVQGTVMAASVPDRGLWCGSPWGMLEVTWDDPDILQCPKRVSPWQVEFGSPTQPLHTTFPAAKRLKFSQNCGSLTDVEEEILFPMTGLNNSTTEYLNPSLLNCNTFSAGMQGARQNPFSLFSVSNLISENTHQMCSDGTFGNNTAPKLGRVSTDLNIGSSQSDNLSPDSHTSVHSFGTELVGNQGCNTKKVVVRSIQLFGKIMHMKQPVESDSDDVFPDDNGRNGFNEREDLNQP